MCPCLSASRAVARLQKVMATFLLRRKKDSKLDGKNLVELPEKKIELVKLEFSQEEREIYAMVCSINFRCAETFNDPLFLSGRSSQPGQIQPLSQRGHCFEVSQMFQNLKNYSHQTAPGTIIKSWCYYSDYARYVRILL